MNPVLIVENPAAGRRRRTRVAAKLARELGHFKLRSETLTLGIRELPSLTDPDRYGAFVVIGGDGTVRSVIQYLAGLQLDIPIAILSRGSGNIIAKSLRMPRSAHAVARLVHRGKTKAIDIAKLDSGEYFMAALAIGYISTRVAATPRAIKKLLGFGGYLISFAQQRRLPIHSFIFSVDGTEHAVTGHSLFIINTTRLFGMHARRSTGMDDGVYELAITVNKTFWSIPRAITDFYVRKKAPRQLVLFRGKRFTMRCDDHATIILDGESIPGHRSVALTVIPRGQRFLMQR